MPTAYLSPSQLQDLTNVSSTAPVSGDNGKALVWNQAAGRWQAEQVAYSNLSGAPALPIPVASGGTGTQTGSITGTEALTFASGANGNISLTPNGTGKAVIGNELDINLRSQNFVETGLNINLPNNQSNYSNGLYFRKGAGYFNVSNGTAVSDSFVPFFTAKNNPNQINQASCLGFIGLYPPTATADLGVVNFNARDTNETATLLRDDLLCFAFWNSYQELGSLTSPSLLFSILGSGNAGLKGELNIRSTSASTSTTTGALRVAGGLGAQGAVNVGGQINGTATTASTSTTTGALVTAGGAGIAGALHVGGQINGLGAVQSGTPASAAATGTAGQIRWDTDYIYVCTATNAWKRVAISTW